MVRRVNPGGPNSLQVIRQRIDLLIRMTNGLVVVPLEVILLKMIAEMMMDRMTNGLVALALKMTPLLMVA